MKKVSIITVCFNCVETIEDTIRSVVTQDYSNKEYIVVDGGSTDGTTDIINRYRSFIQHFISEKDNGLYDALNKGVLLATGDVVAILHADDIYSHEKVLSNVMQAFETSSTDTLYGDLQYVDRKNTSMVVRNWVSGTYAPENFLKGWMPPHPSFFVKRSCYGEVGSFNTSLRSAADYEFMLRTLYKFRKTTQYLPEVLVKMRVGGKSNQSIWNRIRANREDKKAWQMNGLRPRWDTFIRKPLSKLGQFFGNTGK